jgi:5-methylcytosine-specific restriction endonuclease McrA
MSSQYISETIKARVREAANNQCGYCQSLQKYVLGILEIEHIVPIAAGGSKDESNLWLSCRLCNAYKGIQTRTRLAEAIDLRQLLKLDEVQRFLKILGEPISFADRT